MRGRSAAVLETTATPQTSTDAIAAMMCVGRSGDRDGRERAREARDTFMLDEIALDGWEHPRLLIGQLTASLPDDQCRFRPDVPTLRTTLCGSDGADQALATAPQRAELRAPGTPLRSALRGLDLHQRSRSLAFIGASPRCGYVSNDPIPA